VPGSSGAAPAWPGQTDPGILAASGLVAGQGLAGVLVAALAAFGVASRSMPARVSGAAGGIVTLLGLGGLAAFLLRAGATNKPVSNPPQPR
jgi:hypothetical protein